MTSIPKNVYIDHLDDNNYNNTCHNTIQLKPVDVKDNTYIDFDKKNVTIKILDLKLHVKLSKYENIFAKRYTLN